MLLKQARYFVTVVDANSFTEAAEPFRAAPGRWIGAKWGFFCNRTRPKNDSGRLDVLQLRIETD